MTVILEPTKVYYKTSRGKYKAYNDTRHILKGNEMIKKITTIIKTNKKEIQKKAIILGGTALGAFVAGVIVAKDAEPVDGIVIVEEDITVEEVSTDETPKED